MRRFCAVSSAQLASIPRVIPCTTRNELSFPRKFFLSRAKCTDSETDGTVSLKLVSPALLVAEKEEAKAVLTLFLKKRGLSSALAARTITMSDLFIDHLVSKLHSIHKSQYLVGRELSTLEIRDALNPYLESLLEENGKLLVDLVKNFPNLPTGEKPVLAAAMPVSIPVPSATTNDKKVKAISRVSEIGPAGKLRPHILYLIELGMNLEQIKEMARKFPAFAYYSLEGKIQPMVEFLLDLGICKSDIPTILSKRPQLCGISLYENLIPTMQFLETHGVDKNQWAKVIYRVPGLLTYSKQKVEATLEFLNEMGLSKKSIGEIFTRYPNIISYSVEDKLRPTAQYFHSLGVNVALLLYRSPPTFGLSLEANLKPVTKFFLERGFSVEDVGTMISRFGNLYTFSLVENLMPKWEYFLTMDYSASDLVKFPQYFGYSLETRIKPRYALTKESGVKLLLNQMLTTSREDFDKVLKRKVEKFLLRNKPSESHHQKHKKRNLRKKPLSGQDCSE